ncbi:MAG TPA: hypothetical protein VFT95_05130 [Micromonosporaceae bacterium]|nr:hypothetical protein [Micromonosporaceae bacterium]
MTDKEQPEDPANEDRPADEEPESEPRRGQIRFQDAETTKPRPPTVGEQRARRRALEQEAAAERAATEAAERKSKTRRRLLIGGGVTVGVVALVAVWYAAATPDEVTAHCVGDDSVLAADENVCDENYVTSHGGYHSGGIFFLPLATGGYRQYHYNYGGTVGGGGRVTGGTLTAPGVKTTVKTNSGKTVQRGGFGVSSGGKSGGS